MFLDKGEKNNENELLKKGRTHVYPYIEDDPMGPKRTSESYLTDLNKVKNSENPVNGVKGPCPLKKLKFFCPIRSSVIDYMHSVCEGVIKKFFEYWFETGDFLGDHSLRQYMQEIDKRLLSITPPKFVPYTPRSIYSHNVWHAHEYLAFILYYALPVFKNIMKEEHYLNLQKLVVFVETILAPVISIQKLTSLEGVIKEFVKELPELYSPRIMLSGVHELLHLIDETIKHGPLNNINCFPFEVCSFFQF